MNRKILVMGPAHRGALPESYSRAFERLGMEVVRFDSELALMQASRFTGSRVLRRALRTVLWNRVNRQALEIAQQVRPALIFAVKCSFLHPETIRLVRKSVGVPFVNHYPDHPYMGIRWDPREASALRRDLIEVLRQYNTVFMWEPTLVDRLQRDGVSASYLPFALDPELFQPQAGQEGLPCDACKLTHEVAFVATFTRARCAEMAAIRKHTVAIWGNNWPRSWRTLSGQHRVHPPIWGSAVGAVYAKAAVSLNVLNSENLGGPNMRTFEIPGSGGVMLARYSPAQHAFFPEGEAALYYRSPQEIDAQLDILLGDPSLRARLRHNGARLATAETYDVRAATVLRECGLPVSALAPPRSSTP